MDWVVAELSIIGLLTICVVILWSFVCRKKPKESEDLTTLKRFFKTPSFPRNADEEDVMLNLIMTEAMHRGSHKKGETSNEWIMVQSVISGLYPTLNDLHQYLSTHCKTKEQSLEIILTAGMRILKRLKGEHNGTE